MSKRSKTDAVENDVAEENVVKEGVVIGKIAYVGNEPFVEMVIESEDGKMYQIFCGEEVLAGLKENFGHKIRFKGTLTSIRRGPNTFARNDGEFAVESFEVLDK